MKHNATPDLLNSLNLAHAFHRQVERTPNAICASFGEQHWTYAELDDACAPVASALRSAGVGPDVPVAVCVERSLEMVAALLGTLTAGGANIAMDPAYPVERLRRMLADSGARVLIGDASTPAALRAAATEFLELPQILSAREHPEAVNRATASDADKLAYVIYTSGSTGRPKGVEISHRGILNLLAFMAEQFDFGPEDVMLATTSISFDLSVVELFLPLVSGARMVLAPGAVTSDGPALARLIERSAPTLMQATPTAWRLLLDAGWSGCEGLAVIAGGEEVPQALADELMPRVRQMWVGYGPTETTVWSTLRQIAPGERPILVGGPVTGTNLHLVDDRGQAVAEGEVGELLIGGVGLARGYRFDPVQTDERFVPDHFSRLAWQRLYRSGDLFRKRGDGLMEFVGRVDHQVKIRGFRIELAEVEAAIAAHPAVAQAVVVAAGEGARRSLLAGCRLAADAAPAVGALRAFLRETLPEFMLPARFAFFDAFPLTPNRKIDRRAVAESALAAGDCDEPGAAEAGTVDAAVEAVWRSLLGSADWDLHADFFEAGGNSLLVGQLLARIHRQFGVQLTWRQFYGNPTVAATAAAIREAVPGGDTFPTPRAPAEARSRYPLSSAQKRLWFLEQAYPGNRAYTFQCVLHLRGTLSTDALRHSLSEIVRRHAAFRSTFEEHQGEAVMNVRAPEPVSLPIEDLSRLDPEQREPEARARMEDEVGRPFDLGRELPVRWVLYRLGESEHLLLHHEHHLVHDGWSFRVFVGELALLYAAYSADGDSPLPEPTLQFGDFAVAEADWLKGEAARAQLAFWRERLQPDLPPMALPYDRPRPPQQSLTGTSFRFPLPVDLCRDARAFARREGVTLYAVLLAAFHLLLNRYTGETFHTTGCGVANRSSQASESLMGMFVNNVVLQHELATDESFRQLVHALFDWSIEAQENATVPFDHVVRALGVTPDLSRNPLFQVMFNMHDAPIPDVRLDGLDMRLEEVMRNGSAKFDLNVIAMPHSLALTALGSGLDADSISLLWEYSADLFEFSTVESMARNYGHVLQAALGSPAEPVAELAIADPGAGRFRDNDRARDYPRNASLPALFAEQARRTPDAVAVVTDAEELSYGELQTRASRFAARLRARGVEGGVVGLYLTRSVEFLVSVLGILEAGACYLPLNQENPVDRNELMLGDAGARVLVTNGPPPTGLCPDGCAILDWAEPPSAADATHSARTEASVSDPEAPAYIMYTSGSTGTPKGVQVPHRAVTRLVRAQDYAPFTPGERFLLLAPVGFDASTFELWGPLLNGATLVVFEEPWPELEPLEACLRRHSVSVLWLTAALFNRVVDERSALLESLQCVLTGGEALSVPHVRRALRRQPTLQLVNGYGPTESTTFACTHRIDASRLDACQRVPIGLPVANTRCYVLDERRRPVPAGMPGELYIGGDGLALGYVNDSTLTAERFVPDPFLGGAEDRMYRTGDRCIRRENGTIDFLQRLDEQVKIRGFRVEPGEIAHQLKQHPEINDAAVLALNASDEERRLCAYLVTTGPDSLDTGGVRRYLARRLPVYMIPADFVFLQRLPTTVNGKLDRKALPAPGTGKAPRLSPGAEQTPGPAESHEQPPGPAESLLSHIVGEVLGVESVDLDQSFFDLGGHSLSAMRLLSRIEQDTGIKVRLIELFRAPNLRAFAHQLETPADAESA